VPAHARGGAATRHQTCAARRRIVGKPFVRVRSFINADMQTRISVPPDAGAKSFRKNLANADRHPKHQRCEKSYVVQIDRRTRGSLGSAVNDSGFCRRRFDLKAAIARLFVFFVLGRELTPASAATLWAHLAPKHRARKHPGAAQRVRDGRYR
jgi:hypothetical protein